MKSWTRFFQTARSGLKSSWMLIAEMDLCHMRERLASMSHVGSDMLKEGTVLEIGGQSSDCSEVSKHSGKKRLN